MNYAARDSAPGLTATLITDEQSARRVADCFTEGEFADDVAVRPELCAPQPVGDYHAADAIRFVARYEYTAQGCLIAEYFKKVR